MDTNVSKKPTNIPTDGSCYKEIIKCSNGLLNVRKHYKYGYINEKGEEITPMKYDAPADFKDGVALVKRDRGYFLLDERGIERAIY